MSKRNSKETGSNFYSPAKRTKLDITVANGSKTINRQSSSQKQDFDVWGDDFKDEDLEEFDFVATQAFSQEVNISVDESFSSNKVVLPVKPATKFTKSWPAAPCAAKNHAPSPKKNSIFIKPSTSTVVNYCPKPSTSNSNNHKFRSPAKPQVNEPVKCFQEKKPHVTQIFKNGNSSWITQSTQRTFGDFEKKLLNGKNMNSTFLSQNSVVVVPDDAQLTQLSKAEDEKKKLLNELLTKDGEAAFLRQKLQRVEQKLEHVKLETSKMIEEQENKHRVELMTHLKEKESILTQQNFQNLHISNLKEKLKILQKGSVKFIEPHSVNADLGIRNRINTTINRSAPSDKVELKECATLAKVFDKSIYNLKTCVSIYPLKGIPESIFEISEPEKPIVNILKVEKIGKRNLPILQEAETFRIFENPELVKPIVSFVDNKQLNVQFFLPSLTSIMNKTEAEINSRESVATINMIVATTRELLLNTLTSLGKILDALKNDDIRDMNDFYYSSYYATPVSHTDSIWDSKTWYEIERGIESRRSLAVLSYIVQTCTYLGEYITGKRRLKIEQDSSYRHYSQQMTTYNSWSNKECDFEFLEMILQFVTVMGLTRRAHQFSGVINAIAQTLINAQISAGFCSAGLEYIFKIIREIVFSRPLLVCFRSISEVMMTFGSCAKFSERLCVDASSTTVSLSNDTWYFKPGPETCTLEIYLIQLKKFSRDPITVINITYAIVSFMQTILPMDVLPWKEEQRNFCKCCVRLIRFTVKALHECSEINVDELEKFPKPLNFRNHDSIIVDRNFWDELKKKQKNILIKGIRFLSYLLIRESDYVMTRNDTENAFFLFLHNVKNKDLRLDENDGEILERLEILDRVFPSEKSSRSSEGPNQSIGKTRVPVASENTYTTKRIHRSQLQCFHKHFKCSQSS